MNTYQDLRRGIYVNPRQTLPGYLDRIAKGKKDPAFISALAALIGARL